MVQFTLPRNSKVKQGKAWNPPPSGAPEARYRVYRIYRFDPETGRTRASTPIGWTWRSAGR